MAAYAGPLTGQLCQCAACGETFGGERGFDLHRAGDYAPPGKMRGNRRCLSADEMAVAGLVQDDRGIWRRPQPVAFAAANAESGPSGIQLLQGCRFGDKRPDEPLTRHAA